MSTEIDDLKMRVASLEDEFRAVFGKAETIEPAPGSDAEHPPAGYVLVKDDAKICESWLCWKGGKGPWGIVDCSSVGRTPSQAVKLYPFARPIPANEGDSRLAESVAIPVGWVLGFPENERFRYWCKDEKGGGLWGTTARTCVTVRDLIIVPDPSIPWGEGYEAILPSEATEGNEYWSVDRWWKSGGGRCHPSVPGYFAWRRRIPATTPTEPARDLSDKIAESVVQDLQQACHDRDELRATVERLEAELETTKRLLAESLVERDRLKNLHDARKVRIEGFRDVLRERLGDLV